MHLDQLSNYDVIVTTYPLIIHDKEQLLKQSFHMLILDEAQFIKNSKSLSAQIVMQLKASHRLCLTGTPMENHLGELWSLFHFLMPGLLGATKVFTQRYRTPIEKHGDNERRKILSQRIAPFMLRRTKDRKTPISRFQNLEVPLFLISLKAGGTGLNLTAADTVIHIDPWWNPAAENQATDRAYRIGQDKTVFVYKIVTKGTVEEKILELQNKKQALADGLFSDKTTEKSKLTEADLQVLFSAL